MWRERLSQISSLVMLAWCIVLWVVIVSSAVSRPWDGQIDQWLSIALPVVICTGIVIHGWKKYKSGWTRLWSVHNQHISAPQAIIVGIAFAVIGLLIILRASRG